MRLKQQYRSHFRISLRAPAMLGGDNDRDEGDGGGLFGDSEVTSITSCRRSSRGRFDGGVRNNAEKIIRSCRRREPKVRLSVGERDGGAATSHGNSNMASENH